MEGAHRDFWVLNDRSWYWQFQELPRTFDNVISDSPPTYHTCIEKSAILWTSSNI